MSSGMPSVRPSVHCPYVRPSVNTYYTRDAILSEWISMKLGTHIHRVSKHC